ncbi:MAG: RC-LH1 core complex protein PufX [Pseudomonadota bacterium]
MSNDKHWYLENDPKPNLHGWIFRQMAMGAVYAALAFFGVIAVILIIRSIGFILPEDPFAALDAGQRTLRALV